MRDISVRPKIFFLKILFYYTNKCVFDCMVATQEKPQHDTDMHPAARLGDLDRGGKKGPPPMAQALERPPSGPPGFPRLLGTTVVSSPPVPKRPMPRPPHSPPATERQSPPHLRPLPKSY